MKVRVKIVTKMDWPSFRNVAVQVRKALRGYCKCTICDQADAESGGNILFIGTVFRQTLNSLSSFLGQSNVVFYGTTEGHSFVEESSLKVARQVKIVAVSNFVRQMLEEVGVPVAGVVHHGLDMGDRRVDARFLRVLKRKFGDKKVVFTASANHSRKGLDSLLRGYSLVEQEVNDACLVLHSEPTGYYNLSKVAEDLGLKCLWLTNLYGKLRPSQLNAFYDLCSVYVQPSYSEGFGLPMLEAFRFDKPVVAVDAPPFNEVVKHGKSGVLVPLSNVSWFNFENVVLFKMHMYRAEDLARAVLGLVSDEQKRAKMRENIREEKQNWSVERLYPQLLKYFT